MSNPSIDLVNKQFQNITIINPSHAVYYNLEITLSLPAYFMIET